STGRTCPSHQSRSACNGCKRRGARYTASYATNNDASAAIPDPMNVQSPELEAGASPAANRAGGSSFYLAMRILGREKRAAMFEIYSLCRVVDDIADEDRPRPRRLELLSVWRKDIESLYSGGVPPGRENLAQAILRFGLRKDDFLAVIDGVEMDARADIRAPNLRELDLYCDPVPSAL